MIMNSGEEINQLRETVRNTIDNAGIDNLLNNLARQANSKFEEKDGVITLNREDYALLKLMMIDYLNNNFKK
jgi:hypothetical protein